MIRHLQNQTPIPVALNFQTAHNVLLHIAPKPLAHFATLYIDNFTCDNPQAVALQFTNAIGQNVSHQFKIIDTDVSEDSSTIYFEMITPINGVYWCKIMIDGQCVGNVKCVTVK